MTEENNGNYAIESRTTQIGQDEVMTAPNSPSASTDVEHVTPGISAEQQRQDALAGTDRQIKTIQDWMEDEENRPETKEERKKRERMEKSKRIIGAVSDGLSALGNLYFTSQYAPNMYNHEKGSMKEVVDSRIERMKADREKQRDQYLNFSLKLGGLENERARTVREMEAEQERMKLAKEKAEREARDEQARRALDPYNVDKAQADRDYARYRADEAKANADIAPEMARARLATEEAHRGSYEASAANSRASAAAHNRSNVQVVHHFNGKTYPKGSNDYEKDVREAARRYNERHKDDEGFVPIVIDREERTAYDNRTVARRAEEYAGEVETRLAEEREDNMPPSRRKNNEKTPPSRR